MGRFTVRDSKYGETTVSGFDKALGHLALAAEGGRSGSVLDISRGLLAWTHGDHTIHIA